MQFISVYKVRPGMRDEAIARFKATDLAKFAFEWNDLLETEIVPVVDDPEFAQAPAR